LTVSFAVLAAMNLVVDRVAERRVSDDDVQGPVDARAG